MTDLRHGMLFSQQGPNTIKENVALLYNILHHPHRISVFSPWFLLLGWLAGHGFGWGLPFAHAKPTKTPRLLQQVQKRLSQLRTYQVTMKTIVHPPGTTSSKKPQKMTILSELWGKRGKRLRMKLQRFYEGRGFRMKFHMVFDGTWQWVDSSVYLHKRKARASAIRINLARTTTPQRPFDTGYSVRGMGLYPGEDYIETVRLMLDHYRDWKSEGNQTIEGDVCARWQGKMNPSKMLAYLQTTSQNQTLQLTSLRKVIARLTAMRLTVLVSKKHRILRAYRIVHPKESFSMDVTFSKLRWNPKLPAKTFVYTPPKEPPVQDITSRILRARQRAKANHSPPKRTRPSTPKRQTQTATPPRPRKAKP